MPKFRAHFRNLITALLLIFTTQTQAFTDKEKEILAAVDQQLPAAEALLEQAVNINSGTMNFQGVKAVGELFQAQFSELGMATTWVDGSPFGRAGHLIASNTGSGSRKLLLIGHLDTVFAKDDPFQQFRKIDGRYIAGPGTTDMKGGDTIIVAALRALKQAGILDQISVRVVLHGDEESSGKPLSLSKKDLIAAAEWADVALGFEDADGNIETAVVARRSSSSWTLEVNGKPAHSSQIFQPHIGDGAIFESARILDQFRQQLSTIDMLTFNPGTISGGTRVETMQAANTYQAFGKTNVIAQTTTVKGDLRALSKDQIAQAETIMQQIVSNNNLPHTSATLTFDHSYPPLAPTDGNYRLLNLYSGISEELGYGVVTAVNPRNAGAADISFTAGHVEMALDGLGLMGDGGHTRDEVADMSSLEKNIKKAALLIYRLSQQT